MPIPSFLNEETIIHLLGSFGPLRHRATVSENPFTRWLLSHRYDNVAQEYLHLHHLRVFWTFGFLKSTLFSAVIPNLRGSWSSGIYISDKLPRVFLSMRKLENNRRASYTCSENSLCAWCILVFPFHSPPFLLHLDWRANFRILFTFPPFIFC